MLCAAAALPEYVSDKQAMVTQSVEPNDIAFGVHAVLLTLVCLYQFHAYKASGRAPLTPAHGYIVSVLWLLAAYNLLLVAAGVLSFYDPHNQSLSAYSFIDYLGYSKAVISGIKYVPQAYMNWRRQSTVGWSIVNILLDFTGGSLSFTQQFIDAYNRQDGNVIWGQCSSQHPHTHTKHARPARRSTGHAAAALADRYVVRASDVRTCQATFPSCCWPSSPSCSTFCSWCSTTSCTPTGRTPWPRSTSTREAQWRQQPTATEESSTSSCTARSTSTTTRQHTTTRRPAAARETQADSQRAHTDVSWTRRGGVSGGWKAGSSAGCSCWCGCGVDDTCRLVKMDASCLLLLCPHPLLLRLRCTSIALHCHRSSLTHTSSKHSDVYRPGCRTPDELCRREYRRTAQTTERPPDALKGDRREICPRCVHTS